jgi:hypothetical protein
MRRPRPARTPNEPFPYLIKRTGTLLTATRKRIAPSIGLERLLLTLPGLAARLDSATPATVSLRKEVIQPQVLLRLPCYDFTPIMNHTLGLLD